MGCANVQFGALEQLFFILPWDGLATTAAEHPGDIDSHFANRTAPTGLLFPTR
jgi:hypothetical protein